MTEAGLFGSESPLMSKRALIAAALLALATFLLYSGTRSFSIITGDDEVYVFQNPHIKEGFSAASLRWALTADLMQQTANADYWQPLTFLSRLLDFEMWGSWPGGHHLTNAVLHGVNVGLLFLLLYKATGFAARAASVALLWGFHPMLVCSVAWVTDRKSLLAALFSLLALIMHDRLRQAPLKKWSAVVLPLFVAALLSKPAVAPLPILLAAWTIWPPRRVGTVEGIAPHHAWKSSLTQLAMSLPFSIVIFILTSRAMPGAFITKTPLSRCINALLAIGNYVGHWLWPGGYSYAYPFPDSFTSTSMTLATCIGFFLIALGIGFLRIASRAPAYLLGYVWFLALCSASLGLPLAWAPRFAYFASMGLTWGLVDAGACITARIPRARAPLVIGLVVLLAVLTFHEQRFWRDSITLFRHSCEVTENNYEVHHNWAATLMDQGDAEGAYEQLQKSIASNPRFARAYLLQGIWYQREGRETEALRSYDEAIRLAPQFVEPRFNRACLFQSRGDDDSSLAGFQDVLSIDPTYADALNNLGALYFHRGQPDSALAAFTLAFDHHARPDQVAVSAGSMCLVLKRPAQARIWFQTALEANPANEIARANLKALDQAAP